MYVSPNFPTKKKLKEAVKAYAEYSANPDLWKLQNTVLPYPGAVEGLTPRIPRPVEVFSPGPFSAPSNGETSIEGPHYPKPHTWYARVQIKEGVVVKVLS